MKYRRFEVTIPAGTLDQKVEFGDYYRSFMIVSLTSDFEFKVNSHIQDALRTEEIQGFQGEGVYHSIYVSSSEDVAFAIVVYG